MKVMLLTFLGLLLAVLVGGWFFFTYDVIGLLKEALTYLNVWLQSVDPLIFVLALIVLPMVGAPVSIFYLAAGAYGSVQGFLLSFLGIFINLLVTYYLGRYPLRHMMVRLLAQTQFKVPEVRKENCLDVILFVRFCGIPYFFQNYFLAAVRIPFKLYLGVSMLIQAALALGIILLGEAIFEGCSGIFISGLGLIVLVAIVFRYLKRRFVVGEETA